MRNAVIGDAQMMRTHAADVDGFDATDTAVVFQLESRKIAQRVGHVEIAHALQCFARKRLRHHDFAVLQFGVDNGL